MHSAIERANFTTKGERRFVVAQDARDGSLFLLPDLPVSPELREFTRAHLRCPIPGCPSPRLKVMDRGQRRRNGFAHQVAGGGHAGVSEEHVQAQLMLLEWVGRTRPECSADLEWRLDEGRRVADLMVLFPTGQQVALEVQFSAQGVNRWLDRHESYRALGVVDVWLLGNRPPHLVENGMDRVVLTDTHAALLRRGLPLLWVNPSGWIATAMVNRDGFHVAPSPSDYEVEYRVDSIESCRLTPDGLVTPAWDRTRLEQPRWEADRERRRQQQEAATAESERQARKRQSAARAAQAYRTQHQAEWATSPLREQLLERYEQLPLPITDCPAPDGGVFADPQHWHAVICRDLLHRRVAGTFTVGDVYRVLTAAQIRLHTNSAKRAKTVAAYLTRLRELGLIQISYAPDNSGWIREATVVMDLDGYQAHLERERERTRQSLAKQRAASQRAAAEADALRAREAICRAHWDYPLPEHDGHIGRVRAFVPGTGPVLRWHQLAISAIRDPDGPRAAPYPEALRGVLGESLEPVPEDELERFLVAYRDTVGR